MVANKLGRVYFLVWINDVINVKEVLKKLGIRHRVSFVYIEGGFKLILLFEEEDGEED